MVYSKPTAPEVQLPYQPGMPLEFGPPRIEKPDDLDLEELDIPSVYDDII